jgi:PiT family inorganic phosphate transporter
MGRRGTTVRWSMVGRIALGWLFTLPAAGIVGALTALLVNTGVVGILIAAIAGTGAVLFMFFYSRKSAVGHHNAVEVEEAGQAVRFAKKKARAKARADARAKASAEAKGKAEAKAQPKPRTEADAAAQADADATTPKETQR